MFLFFDTETTGVPKNYKASASDLENWPRLVQLGYLLYDKNKKLIASGDYIIKPDGFIIPDEAAKVHGIKTERALNEGKELTEVLSEIAIHIKKSDYLIAHNMAFDEKILGAELLRSGFSNIIEKKTRICTMQTTTEFCAIPGPYGFKWPKLSELHIKLFGNDFDGAHSAFADIEATAKCFWTLIGLKIIEVNLKNRINNDTNFNLEVALDIYFSGKYYDGEDNRFRLLYDEYIENEKLGAFKEEHILKHNIDIIYYNILVPFRKGELWGFSDYNKNIKIPCQFLAVNEFDEGLAFVKVNDKWGFINEIGDLEISAKYSFLSYSYFKNGLCVVKIERKVGVISNSGEIIIPVIYDDLSRHENLFLVKLENKYGLINVSNKLVIHIIYDNLIYVSESLIFVEKEKKYGFINIKEEVIIPIIYDELKFFHNGLAKFKKGKEIGFMNEKGTVVLKLDYEDASDFEEGFARVKNNNKWGFINTIGLENVPLIYDDVSDFKDGFAAVRRESKWGVVNIENKIIVPFKYDYIGEFNNGLANVELKGKSGFIDNTGNIVIPIVYDRAANHFRQMIRVMKGKYWGIIDSNGKIVIEVKYDSISAFKDKITKVKINGKYGYINIDGVEFWDQDDNSTIKLKINNNKYFKHTVNYKTNCTDLENGYDAWNDYYEYRYKEYFSIDVFYEEIIGEEQYHSFASDSLYNFEELKFGNELNHNDDYQFDITTNDLLHEGYYDFMHNKFLSNYNSNFPKYNQNKFSKPKLINVIQEKKLTLKQHVKSLIDNSEFIWLTDLYFERTTDGIKIFKNENEKRFKYILDLFGKHNVPEINYENFENNILTDVVGNKYQTIKFLGTFWMAQNLDTAYFKNGDKIPEARSNEDWDKFGVNCEACWCYFDNDPNKSYGKLYNWYAVNDKRGLAPSGWKIPTVKELFELRQTCQNKDVGKKLKSYSSWKKRSIFFKGDGEDFYRFNAKPSGIRDWPSYNFVKYREESCWWTKTEKPNFPTLENQLSLYQLRKVDNKTRKYSFDWENIKKYSTLKEMSSNLSYNNKEAIAFKLSYDSDSLFYDFYNKRSGYAVRCVKNEETLLDWYKRKEMDYIENDKELVLKLFTAIHHVLNWTFD